MKQNILVIDDDKNIREVVKLYLRKEGYEVTEAADGAIGVDLFFGKQYDLVILDIMMPVQDGIETIKQIRAKSNVPVIMLTAKGETFDKDVYKRQGIRCSRSRGGGRNRRLDACYGA